MPEADVLEKPANRMLVLGSEVFEGEDEWKNYINCIGINPDMFFPEYGYSEIQAKDVCRNCVVREDCLDYAIAGKEKFGVWGGMNEKERRRIRRMRNKAARSAKRSDKRRK